MKFQTPTAETPGFLRRMKKALSFSEQLQSGKLNAPLVDELVDFLSEFITEPADKTEAKEMLLDASQSQFIDMLGAIMGAENTVPPETSKP